MKRIIVTLCSLALSLAGTFGVNQLSSKDDTKINSNLDVDNAVQYAEDADNQNDQLADTKTTTVDDEGKKAADKVYAAAPEVKAEKATANTEATTEVNETSITKEDQTDVNNKQVVIEETSLDNKEAVKETGLKNATEVSTNAENSYAAKASTQVPTAKTPEQTPAVKSPVQAPTVKQTVQTTAVNNTPKATNVNSYNTNSGQVYVYKNIDLSNCDNTQEVINQLQKNGLNNINKNNIQSIDGLNDILALINGQKENTTKPAAPAPTTKPAAPAPTTKPTAPAPTTKPSAPSSNSGISSYANQVLQLVNQERAKAGLSAFKTNSTITAAANKRAQETVQSFSHTRPNGTSFSSVLKEYGVSYRTAGENIAYGQRSPQEVVTGWMNSPGHRANILNANFNTIGIGVYQQNGVIYWSQLFTN